VSEVTQLNDVAITPDGALLLAVAQGATPASTGALLVFSREVDGSLTFEQVFVDGDPPPTDGVKGAFSVQLDPNGDNAYVGSETDAFDDDPLNPERGAVAIFDVPEPAAGAAGIAALLALALSGRWRASREGAGTPR
jgi:hypothetical protein